MKRLALGITIGFLAASTLAWAFTVKFPNTLKIRGMALVDEAGNVLGGTTPMKITVPDETGAQVVVDDNGVVVGSVSRPLTTGSVYLTRDISGLTTELRVDYLNIEGASGSGSVPLYYESVDCTGQPYFPAGGGFYRDSHSPDGTLYFVIGQIESITRASTRTALDSGGFSACNAESGTSPMYPMGTLDLTQFVPPFTVETQ